VSPIPNQQSSASIDSEKDNEIVSNFSKIPNKKPSDFVNLQQALFNLLAESNINAQQTPKQSQYAQSRHTRPEPTRKNW